MNGAKDFREQSGVVGQLLEFRETALHAIKAFLALNQKLSCQFIGHVGLSFRLDIRFCSEHSAGFIGGILTGLERHNEKTKSFYRQECSSHRSSIPHGL